jgi:hypothetical protein
METLQRRSSKNATFVDIYNTPKVFDTKMELELGVKMKIKNESKNVMLKFHIIRTLDFCAIKFEGL